MKEFYRTYGRAEVYTIKDAKEVAMIEGVSFVSTKYEIKIENMTVKETMSVFLRSGERIDVDEYEYFIVEEGRAPCKITRVELSNSFLYLEPKKVGGAVKYGDMSPR